MKKLWNWLMSLLKFRALTTSTSDSEDSSKYAKKSSRSTFKNLFKTDKAKFFEELQEMMKNIFRLSVITSANSITEVDANLARLNSELENYKTISTGNHSWESICNPFDNLSHATTKEVFENMKQMRAVKEMIGSAILDNVFFAIKTPVVNYVYTVLPINYVSFLMTNIICKKIYSATVIIPKDNELHVHYLTSDQSLPLAMFNISKINSKKIDDDLKTVVHGDVINYMIFDDVRESYYICVIKEDNNHDISVSYVVDLEQVIEDLFKDS